MVNARAPSGGGGGSSDDEDSGAPPDAGDTRPDDNFTATEPPDDDSGAPPDAGNTRPNDNFTATEPPEDITPDPVEVDDSRGDPEPVDSREDAAQSIDDRLSGIDIGADDIEERDGRFELNEETRNTISERNAAVELDEQYDNVDIGIGDLRRTEDGGFTVREGERQQQAEAETAEAFDERFSGVDITERDVEFEDGTGSLNDLGAGRIQADRTEAMNETASGVVDEAAAGAAVERVSDIEDVQRQRDAEIDAFREEAADELDVDPDDVEVTVDGDEVRAESTLTQSQAFFDELAGGRLEGVVEAGQDAQEATGEAVSTGVQTVGTVSALPATLAGGAAARELEAVGFEAPGVGEVGDDFVEDVRGSRGEVVEAFDSGASEVQDVAEPVTEVVEDAYEFGGQAVPDVMPRDGAETITDAAGNTIDVLTDTAAAGAPSQPTLGPEGVSGVDTEPVEAPGVDNESEGGDGLDISAKDAFALGAAGVVTPEPSTTIGGGVIAGGAALALGAGALSQRNEIDVPEDGNGRATTTELDVGAGDADVVELEPGEAGQSVSELDVGANEVEATEIGVPDEPTGSTTGEVDVPTVEASGVLEQVSEGELDDEETGIVDQPDFVIDDNVIEDTGPTVEIPEDEQMRQIREELERRQEFVREDTDFTQVDREPVRTFGEEAAEPTVEAEGFESTEAFDNAFESNFGSFTDPFAGIGAGNDVEAGVEGGLDTAVDSVADVEALPDVAAVEAVDTSVDTFADPSVEATGFEAVEATNPTVNQAASTSNGDRRRRPRFPDLEGDDLDDLDDFGFGVEAETFEYDVDLPDFLR